MFQMFTEIEKRICFTTGGICPHREDVVPLCVTEGFCGGKRGPKTGIERLVWKPFTYLDDSDVAGSLAKAGAVSVGHEGTVSCCMIANWSCTQLRVLLHDAHAHRHIAKFCMS